MIAEQITPVQAGFFPKQITLNSNLFGLPQIGQFEFHFLSTLFTIADDRN
jgi:hypothetical protein